jgi:DNA polymerase/3'-5' exonuclease PolX
VPFAILYFTGSGEFNKNMRIYAQKLGYKLNEYCLEKLDGDSVPTGHESKKIYLKNEKEIFQFLKLKYVNPSDRVRDYCFP